MRTDILELVSEAETTDAYGDPAIVENSRVVFCTVKSIGEKEFYHAHAVGLQPEIKFVLEDYYDYGGEMYIVYNGDRYKVLRTYRTGNKMELTCYREDDSGGNS